jgi:hypothetical protein
VAAGRASERNAASASQMGRFETEVLTQPEYLAALTTLKEKLIKIGAKVVHHARKVVFQIAEVAVPRGCSGNPTGD